MRYLTIVLVWTLGLAGCGSGSEPQPASQAANQAVTLAMSCTCYPVGGGPMDCGQYQSSSCSGLQSLYDHSRSLSHVTYVCTSPSCNLI